MKLRLILTAVFSIIFFLSAEAQSLSLQECIDRALENNISIKIAEQSVETRQQQYDGSKKNFLPKVDLLAGYNYIGKPLRLDMNYVKDGVATGTSQQITDAGDLIYTNITGEPMSQEMRDQLYQSSYDIISKAFPDYNPVLSKQGYFMAGLLARQPIYTGGKLNALNELSYQQLESGKIMLENTQDLIAYNTSLQYIQVLFYNSMIEKQEEIVDLLTQTDEFAAALIRADILPPYQKGWAEIALSQAKTHLESLKVDKENTLMSLKDLMGLPLNTVIIIEDKLPEEFNSLGGGLTSENHSTDIRLLESKKAEANVALKVAKSGYKPNIFAIGNLQLYKNDLPVITPPWMVGVEMQWNLFDGFKTQNKVRAAESLIEETNLLIEKKQKSIELGLQLAENKIMSIENQIGTLDEARNQTYTTTSMVRLRMENDLSSVKDVNDALQLQITAEKAYYISLTAYYTAVATHYFLKGEIDKFPKTLMR